MIESGVCAPRVIGKHSGEMGPAGIRGIVDREAQM